MNNCGDLRIVIFIGGGCCRQSGPSYHWEGPEIIGSASVAKRVCIAAHMINRRRANDGATHSRVRHSSAAHNSHIGRSGSVASHNHTRNSRRDGTDDNNRGVASTDPIGYKLGAHDRCRALLVRVVPPAWHSRWLWQVLPEWQRTQRREVIDAWKPLSFSNARYWRADVGGSMTIGPRAKICVGMRGT